MAEPKPTLTVAELIAFIDDEMRMSHIYQPLLIQSLVESGGQATLRELAVKFLSEEEAEIRAMMETIGENWNLPSPLLLENRPDDWVELIRVQWRDLAEELMAQYNSALKKGDTNSVSNFTKRDDVYRKNILSGMLGVSLFGSKRRVEDTTEFL